ncbi:MAG: ribonuclease E/G, partial [Alphaproteobacteria bacterium]
MLIDATHAGETRVAVVDSRNRLEDFDFETAAKAQVKGNVYLAKVTRVEPSLQAAFVEFGGNRHGFLPFNEIHTDYYQIPVADREALTAEADRESDGNGEASHNEDGDGEPVETVGGTDDSDADEAEDRRRRAFARRYKIQEVIKRRQILLVQVTKEERGTKGAALTTYLSLAGRYCVLMPNTPRGGGVSRKIASAQDRKRLRSVVEEMQLPAGMAVIVRTAGQDRTKTEIKRDCDYLMRLWSDIRENTMKSTAPALIHAEGDLVRRSIRDLYRGEIDELLVEGEEGYRAAKDFMRMLMPSHARRVKQYKNESVPLFHDCGIVGQIDDLHDLDVKLPAGGSIVINQTEALVAIDVNSGRATRERNIEETAYKTNLEAADEVARQLRLRDLAGLIVIDFIDMDDTRHVHAVERRLKAALANDRARIQLGRISPFGLMEMSRQRMRPSLIEATYNVCSTCGGTGLTRNIPSSALHVLRAAEESCMRGGGNLTVHTATPVALHILNDKRDDMLQIEQRFGVRLRILGDDSLTPPAYRIESDRGESGEARPESRVSRGDDRARSEEAPRQEERPRGEEEARGRRRPRRGRRRDGGEGEASSAETGEEEVSATPDAEGDSRERTTRDSEDGDGRPRRRRGRRGGRRRRRRDESSEAGESGQNDQAAASEPAHDDQTGDEQVGDAANGAGG